MSLARRNLFQNKVRLFLNATGVALSVMLILVLGGFLSGVYKQATAYLNGLVMRPQTIQPLPWRATGRPKC